MPVSPFYKFQSKPKQDDLDVLSGIDLPEDEPRPAYAGPARPMSQMMEMPEPVQPEPEMMETTLADEQTPDLDTKEGLFAALSKRYPDMGAKPQRQAEQKQDEGMAGVLFQAASRAASSAGAIGGKQAKSGAGEIVDSFRQAEKQKEKDLIDDESLAVSEISGFARNFMRDNLGVDVPDNVTAAQLKTFMPAITQQYLAQKRAEQSERAQESQMQRVAETAGRTSERQTAQQEFVAEQNRLNREQREREAALKPAAKVPETPREKLQMKLVEKDAEVYQKRLQGLQKLDGSLKSLDDATTAEQIVQIGQSMLKTLNDPENSDAVGVDEAKRLADELQSWSVLGPGGLLRIGRDLPGFKQRVKLLRDRLYNTANTQYKTINQKTPDLVDPPPSYGATTGAARGGRSVEEIDAEIARIKAEKARRKGGQ
jgi:hypothetical protein